MPKVFPENLIGKTRYPWSYNPFKVDEISTKFPDHKMKVFNTFIMKGMFACKQAKQDV
jgi:hypothetical protein